MPRWLDSLRNLREKLGTAELARRLGIPAASLRRLFSTGRWSERLRKRAQLVLTRHEAARHASFEKSERTAIQKEPELVPGYGFEKQKWVLKEIRKLRGQASLDWQETRNAIRTLEKQKIPVPPETRENLDRFFILNSKLQDIEKRLTPPAEKTLEEQLEAVINIEREAPQISRRTGVTTRAIYTLFFSPPSHGVPIAAE